MTLPEEIAAGSLGRENLALDHIFRDKFVFVMKCTERISSGFSSRESRNGWFYMNQAGHDELKAADGFYLFIVSTQCQVIRARLVRAVDLEFQKHLTWTKIFSKE